jgi:hypothetical protein
MIYAFSPGLDPRINKGTMFLISPGDEHDLSEATAVIGSVDAEEQNRVISLTVNVPYHSVIGTFHIRVNIKKQGARKFSRHVHEQPINVLFNPWCKGTVHCSSRNNLDFQIQ